MPDSCYGKSDFEWSTNMPGLCNGITTKACWLCKVFKDQKEKDRMMPKVDGTSFMVDWLKKEMKKDKWNDIGPEDLLLRMYVMLTKDDQEMSKEKNFVSNFGAVRLTRLEVAEMIDRDMMGNNFSNVSGFIKVLDEDMTGEKTRMAFLCTMDRGNPSYSHFLKIVIIKAMTKSWTHTKPGPYWD
jgi:hypothetical protein